MNYKKILMRITIVFLVVLLMFTFLSRTLVDLHVPRVEVAFSQQGVIQSEAVSSGIVRPANTERVFAPVSGRITQILEPGDTIHGSTVIFTISNDISALYEMLADAEHQWSIVNLNIQRTISDQQYEQQRLTSMLAGTDIPPTPPTLNLWVYDMQLENNTNDMARILDEFEALETLYAEGVIPRQDITARENEVERLAQQREQILRQRDQAIASHEAAMDAHENTIANVQQNRETQVQNQRNRISQLGFTLTSHNLELERIDNRIDSILEQIADDGAVEVRLEAGAFSPRTVAEFLPGIDVGATIQEGAPIMITNLSDNQFEIEAAFPLIQDFIATGQNVDVSVGTAQHEGRTRRIQPDGGRNIVTIAVESRDLAGGELAQVTVSSHGRSHPDIIPLSALREDTFGYFVLFVESVERFLGSNYYVFTQRVDVSSRDNTHVAISAAFGHAFQEDDNPIAIIVNSDIPVHSGDRVRLVGAGEFAPAR